MAIRRVDPDEAARMQAEGWIYLDVRSVPEFEQGHPAGAYNAPYLHETPAGRVANPDFLRVVAARFPPDARLLVGCRTGSRSLHAAADLLSSGRTEVVDVRGGYAGEPDPLGGVACAGWT